MIPFAVAAASALVLIPYEPSYDCAMPPDHAVVELVILNGSEILWYGSPLSRKEFESYLIEWRKQPLVFRVLRDGVSSDLAAEIVSKLKAADLPSGQKSCEGIP